MPDHDSASTTTPMPAAPCLPGAVPGQLPHLHDGLSPALYCGLLAIDIIGFGRRPTTVYPHLREALTTLLTSSLSAVGIALPMCHQEDRGDAAFLVLPPGVSLELLLGPFPTSLQTGLRRHNRLADPAARLRIRAAVNAGFVWADQRGIIGRPANELFRLLDATQYKAVLADQNADLGLITTEHLYTELIAGGPGLIDPHTYQPLTITAKELHAPARLWLPPLTPPPPPPAVQPSSAPSRPCPTARSTTTTSRRGLSESLWVRR